MSKKVSKARRITAELRRIASSNGGLLLPQDVVDAARPKTSVLHSRFEWDDDKAAESYRLWQARQLIRVTVEMLPGIAAPTEVFVSLTPDRNANRGYRIVTDVLSDAQLRQIMLEDAVAELEVFKTKYARLRQLAVVFQAIRKVKRK
jgi:hypothetical protein